MRIRSLVKLAFFSTISIVLIYGAFTIFINRILEAKFRDLGTSSKIRVLFDQLQEITNDYFLYGTERADQQWRILHLELLQMVNSQGYKTFQRKYQIEDLTDKLRLLGDTFNKLSVASRKIGMSKHETKGEFQNRLITQISLNTREIGASFDAISRNIEGEVLSLQRSTTVMDMTALVLVVALISGISVFLSKSVMQPILKLHEGAEIIGRGDLDYRIESTGPGEIRELSESFNRMTVNLGNLTATLKKSQDDLRFLASQLIGAQEEERQRIGMELHDDLGQLLMVLKMQLRALEKKESMEIKGELEHLHIFINEIIDRVRRLARNLRPSVLEDMGLTTGLKLLFEDFQNYQGMKLKVEMDDIQTLFPWENQILIYRIFQESLTNVVKHAGATQVSVSVKKQDGCVAFNLEDNGCGFNLQQVLNKNSDRGLGLASINERIRMLHGELQVWSQPEQGTRLYFTVPFASPKL
jgi:signal transduction histidine kinase